MGFIDIRMSARYCARWQEPVLECGYSVLRDEYIGTDQTSLPFWRVASKGATVIVAERMFDAESRIICAASDRSASTRRADNVLLAEAIFRILMACGGQIRRTGLANTWKYLFWLFPKTVGAKWDDFAQQFEHAEIVPALQPITGGESNRHFARMCRISLRRQRYFGFFGPYINDRFATGRFFAVRTREPLLAKSTRCQCYELLDAMAKQYGGIFVGTDAQDINMEVFCGTDKSGR